jgi:hypothetical protein
MAMPPNKRTEDQHGPAHKRNAIMNGWTLQTMTIAAIMTAQAVAGGPEPSNAPDDYYVHTQGSSYRIRIVSNSIGSINLPDPLPTMRMSQGVTEDITCTCIEARPDHTAVDEWTFDRIAMRQSMPGGNIDYDSADPTAQTSDNPAAASIGRIVGAMVGAKVRFTIGADGQVTRVTGFQEMMDRMFDEMEAHVPSIMKKTFFKSLRDNLDDDSLAEQTKTMFRMLPPPDKRRVGETWEKVWSFKMPFSPAPLLATAHYTLLEMTTHNGAPCMKVQIDESYRTVPAEQSGEQADAAAPLAGFNFVVHNAKGEGIALLDYRSGALRNLQSTQDIDMEMSMPAIEADSETHVPAVGPIRLKFTQAIELEELDEPAPEEPAPTTQPAQ